jgi:hypothetical protein
MIQKEMARRILLFAWQTIKRGALIQAATAFRLSGGFYSLPGKQ